METKDGQIAHRTILASSRNRQNAREFAIRHEQALDPRWPPSHRSPDTGGIAPRISLGTIGGLNRGTYIGRRTSFLRITGLLTGTCLGERPEEPALGLNNL